MREERDPRARDDLLCHYDYLCEGTLSRHPAAQKPQVSPSLDRDDLLCAARYALMVALDRYDPARGVKFATFAIHYIRGAILEALRRDDWVPRKERERERQGELVDLLYQISLYEPVQRNKGLLAGDRQERVEDFVPDPAPGPEALLLDEGINGDLQERLERLDERERRVIEMFYLEKRSIREIAAAFDRCVSLIAKWKRRALQKLRAD